MDVPVLPAHPTLARLLPSQGLAVGASYQVGGSMQLLFSLLSAPTRAGSWCAVVGMPEFGVEAAEHAGVDLDRVVMVPRPDTRWFTVTATLADAFPLVVVRPGARIGARDMSRLAARLRERGAVLLVQGPWPQADAVIDVTASQFSGLGEGDGYLARHVLTVSVSSRRMPMARTGEIVFPATAEEAIPRPLLRAVS